MTCACTIREDYPDPDKVHLGVIVYCPLHAAAPLLLTGLKRALVYLEHPDVTVIRFAVRSEMLANQIRAHLAEIEEGTQ